MGLDSKLCIHGIEDSMVIEKKYRLRWVLEYIQKKPIYGIWDNSSDRPEDSAWIRDKTGLKYAAIEAEEMHSWGQYRFIECTADRFVQFKWIAAVSIPGFGSGQVRSAGDIIGLSLITPEHSFTVYVDGKIEKKELSEHDKKFDLKEFKTRVI